MVSVSEGKNGTSEGLRSVFILSVDIKYTNIKFTIIDIVLSCLVSTRNVFCQHTNDKHASSNKSLLINKNSTFTLCFVVKLRSPSWSALQLILKAEMAQFSLVAVPLAYNYFYFVVKNREKQIIMPSL